MTNNNHRRWYTSTEATLISKILKKRAEIFNCSYKTAWDQHLSNAEKKEYSYLEVFEFIKN